MAKRPHRIGINGEPFQAVILRVAERDEKGRPKVCVAYYPDESVAMEEGAEFTIAYIAEGTLAAAPVEQPRVVAPTNGEVAAVKRSLH